MIYGIVYLYRNKINGKCYVGQTIQSVKQRHKSHLKNRYAIGCALRKYGVDNFEISIVEHCNSQDELNDAESYYVQHYRSLYPNGYNLTTGGGQHGKPCEESRRKKSDAVTGEKHPMFGKRCPEETRRKISEANSNPPEETRRKMSNGQIKLWADIEHREHMSKAHIGNPGYWKGKTLSEETRRKISEANSNPSDDRRKQLSDNQKGKPSYWKGKTLAEEHRKRLSASCIGREAWNRCRIRVIEISTGHFNEFDSITETCLYCDVPKSNRFYRALSDNQPYRGYIFERLSKP